MTNFEFKIYLMAVIILLSGTNVLAQENSANQPLASSGPRPVSSKERPASDVVEVETEIGVKDMKPSNVIDKPAVKIKSGYTKDKVNKKKVSASDADHMQSSVFSDASEQPDIKPSVESIPDVKIVELSSNLRKLIEDNNKLKDQISVLDMQLKTVHGQQKLDTNRFNEVALERDALKKQNEHIVSLGLQTQQQLEALKQQLTQKEEDYNKQIDHLKSELSQKSQNSAVDQSPSAGESQPGAIARPSVSVSVVSSPVNQEAQERREKIFEALDTISAEKKKLSRDEAKVHYNMGNTYFNSGNYAKAAKEYQRAIDLTPEDASAHYNLAFVSGEYLHDPKNALEHYKKYLFFNPGAEDAQAVHQRIIEAQVAVSGEVNFNSNIGEEVKKKKNESNGAPVE